MNLNYQKIVFIASLIQFCSASKFHSFQSILEDSCDVHFKIERDNGYIDFFKISSMKNNNLKKDELLHFNFYVITSMDAHILLSVNNTLTWNKSDRYYEIALGYNRNSLSLIKTRFEPESDIVQIAGNSSGNILSPFHPTLVEIIQKTDGELIVNVPGYAEPLMKFIDKNPVNIQFFSFTTWNLSPSKWFYDCQFDENSNMEGQNNNEEKLLAISKLLSIDSHMKQVMEFCWSGIINRHKSWFHGLVPTLDTFDENQVLDFQQGVIEVMKKVKKTSTSAQPSPVDLRFGGCS